MVEITNEDELKAWLDSKGRDVAVAIGTRAALRVLPLIADYVHELPAERAATLVLPIFRGAALPWLAAPWPSQRGKFLSSANVTARDLSRASGVARSAISSRNAARLACRTADAVQQAVLTARHADSGLRAVTATVHAAEATPVYTGNDASRRYTGKAGERAYLSGTLWAEITADANASEKGDSSDSVMRRQLWTGGTPELIARKWTLLKSDLLALNEDWQVWTGWYEDCLRGSDHPDSHPLIEELEFKRVLIPDDDWKLGPKHVNAMIAELEAEYRAKPPPQRPAIIEVEYGVDGKLHRRPSSPPKARDEAQDQRLREAWQAHSEQLAVLGDMDPGKNSPAFGQTLDNYRAALGSSYDTMKVIALGVHGASIVAYADSADVILLEDAAAELVGLAAAHGLFIRQFDAWLDYLNDATGEPSIETVEAAIQIARSTSDVPDLIADDVAIPINELADAAERPLAANPEDRPPKILERELLRSLGNVLSGMLARLVELARDMGGKAREGMLRAVEHSTYLATLAVVFAGTEFVVTLATGAPGQFGWLIPVLKFLKMKLGL